MCLIVPSHVVVVKTVMIKLAIRNAWNWPKIPSVLEQFKELVHNAFLNSSYIKDVAYQHLVLKNLPVSELNSSIMVNFIWLENAPYVVDMPYLIIKKINMSASEQVNCTTSIVNHLKKTIVPLILLTRCKIT